MGEAAPSPRHLPALDGVRGLAILAVIVFHCSIIRAPIFDMGDSPAAWLSWFAQLTRSGWVGVDLFFVLSGFLITGILLDAKEMRSPLWLRNFYLRRALRIWPLYLLIVGVRLVMFAVGDPFSNQRETPVSTLEVIAYLTHTTNLWMPLAGPDARHFDPILGVTWSLATEEQFYLMWPWLVAWLSRRSLARLCVLILVCSPLIRLVEWAAFPSPAAAYMLPFGRFDGFAVGGAVALLVRRERLPSAWLGPALVIGACVVFTGITLYQRVPNYGLWMMATVGLSTTIAGAAGLILWAGRPGWLSTLLSTQVLRQMGKYSYAAYLLHGPVAYYLSGLGEWVIRQGAPAPLGYLSHTVCTVAVTFAASWLSWCLFERHFLRLKSRVPMTTPSL